MSNTRFAICLVVAVILGFVALRVFYPRTDEDFIKDLSQRLPGEPLWKESPPPPPVSPPPPPPSPDEGSSEIKHGEARSASNQE